MSDREGFFRLLAIGILGLGSLALVPDGQWASSPAPAAQAVKAQSSQVSDAALANDLDRLDEADAINNGLVVPPYVIINGSDASKKAAKAEMAQNIEAEEFLKEMSKLDSEAVAN